jgi:hypothetical protein
MKLIMTGKPVGAALAMLAGFAAPLPCLSETLRHRCPACQKLGRSGFLHGAVICVTA